MAHRTKEARNAYQSVYRARVYLERKVAEVCIDCRAGLQEDDGVRCVECTERERDARALRYHTPEGRIAAKETVRARRARLVAAGVCITCTRPRGEDGTKLRCRSCQDDANEYSADYKARKTAGVISIGVERDRREEIQQAREDELEEIRIYEPHDTPIGCRARILRAMRLMDWATTTEILEAAGVPDNDEAGDSSERNAHTKAISRLKASGLIESREIVFTRGGNAREHRLSKRGRAEVPQ